GQEGGLGRCRLRGRRRNVLRGACKAHGARRGRFACGRCCAPPVARPPAGSSKMNCNARIGAMRVGLAPAAVLLIVLGAVTVTAAEHPSLAKARALYNALDF